MPWRRRRERGKQLDYNKVQRSGFSKIAGRLESLDAGRLKDFITVGLLASQPSSLQAMSNQLLAMSELPET
jgi:hypothetical protein